MTARQLHWSQTELLESDPVVEPLIVAGRRCHGGYDAAGRYVTPRTKGRNPAVVAWQAQFRDDFGTDLLEAPLDTWPDAYPNVAQSKHLLRHGVRRPIITSLTRIGTVEGFGGLIRMVAVDDLQRCFADSIDGTCAQHMDRGLFEAHARDEAGWEDEVGHRDMWFAARDIAFEAPPTEDETARMLARMGIPSAPGGPGAQAPPGGAVPQVFDDLDPRFESMLRRMISLLFIEVSAFHTFAWAEAVLSDPDLTAGEGRAAEIVSHIRADETPHVDYLRTALSEMRARTMVGESGRHIPGAVVIDRLWDLALAESLGTRRASLIESTLAELDDALAGNPRRADILAEFHALGSVAPPAAGA